MPGCTDFLAGVIERGVKANPLLAQTNAGLKPCASLKT
jgi:predicted small secreted protein